ncbi:MAG TPA: hypothetical protein VLN61_06820 [Pseudolabrys sp.]|nr:hypothetical protein [Pseudolabrys sp.]
MIALAIAACASTSVEVAQTSVGGAPPRPKTVLVNDFVFSPDVTVVDRDFTARLESKLGNPGYDIIKLLPAKRVNDEVVAMIIVILHDDAGLNAQPSSDVEITPQDGTLVITGQLHAVDQANRAQRNSVGFGIGGSVVADMTVSQVSEGTKKQLVTFTAQAQSGRQSGAAITGPAATARNMQITAVLTRKSAPDVNLSPNVEAQARGLGRAIADKIVAYAVQQGWAHKVDLPEPPPDAKPVKKKPEKLPVAVAKQGGSPLPPNTIPCKAFTKRESGNWYVAGPVTLDLGSAENKTLQNIEIPPKFFTIGGVDLYDAIQKKCGSNRSQ